MPPVLAKSSKICNYGDELYQLLWLCCYLLNTPDLSVMLETFKLFLQSCLSMILGFISVKPGPDELEY